MIRAINKLTAPLARRVHLMVARGVLALVNDVTKMQDVQVKLLSGETRDMERFQNYGFTSQPHPGAEVAAVFVGGNRDHGLVLAIDDRRYRHKDLLTGEVAIYTAEGDSVVMKNGRIIEITTQTLKINATTQIEINTPTMLVSASTKVEMTTPLLQVTNGDVKADTISLKTHRHAGSAIPDVPA